MKGWEIYEYCVYSLVDWCILVDLTVTLNPSEAKAVEVEGTLALLNMIFMYALI